MYRFLYMNVYVPLIILIVNVLHIQASELPCAVYCSKDTINLGKSYVNDELVDTMSITNTSAFPITISNPDIYSRFPVFACINVSTNTLQPNQTAIYTFSFKTVHNISYSATASFSIGCASGFYSKSIILKAQSEYQDTEFAFTQNIEGQALFNALNAYLQNQTVYSYSDARTHMFGKADNVNGYVECIYTGRKIQTNGIPNANDFNCEHSWPQSKGSDKEPARTDIYHLYPSDSKSNEKRSNNPFGKVTRSILWEVGGSKLGLPTGSSDTTFEPRDESKGNIARGLLYYCTRYGNRKGTFDKDGFLTGMETILRDWNKSDPVDQREKDRCESIASVQKRKNPYVDHPEIIDRMYKLSTQPEFPLYPEIITNPKGIYITVNSPNDSIDLLIPISNKGNQFAKVLSTEFRPSTESAAIISIDTIIKPGVISYAKIRLKQGVSSGTALRIRFADGLSTLTIPIATEISSSVPEISNYESPIIEINPNPGIQGFDQYISFQVQSRKDISLKIFDIKGKELADLSASIDWQGLDGRIAIPSKLLSYPTLLCRVHSIYGTRTQLLFTGASDEK